MNVFLIVILSLFLTPVRGDDDWVPIKVQTEAGQVTGRLGGGVIMNHCAFVPWMKEAPGAAHVASFYGIPYAEEPTGSLRFAPPKPRVPFGELNATMLPPVCPQVLPLPPWVPHWLPGFSTDENCLTLNVWTKAPFAQASRPVLVFIHGGAFIEGNGYTDLGCAFYNGNPIAADAGLVVVTLNYRLGVLGFADLPELRAEAHGAGNYGLLDQRLALQWVQQNIARFGGDPNRVTIHGESAGAASVLHHAVLPLSQGLFSRAIVESSYDNPVGTTRAYAEARDRAFATSLGCPTAGSGLVQCLRNASSDAVLKAQSTVMDSPAYDFFGSAFTYYPVAGEGELDEGETLLTALAKSKVKVPILIGSNANETALFQCSLAEDMSLQEAAQQVSRLALMLTGRTLLPSEAMAVLAMYPVGQGGWTSQRSALIGASTDITFGCPTRQAARAVAPPAAAYRYVLGRSPLFSRVDKCLGVPHIVDTFYVFYNNITGHAMDKGDKTVAKAVMASWFAFARGEEPSFPAGFSPEPWPQWGHASEASFWFNEEPHVEKGFHTAACNTVDKIVWRLT